MILLPDPEKPDTRSSENEEQTMPVASITQGITVRAWKEYSNYLKAHGHPQGTIEQYINYPSRLCRDLGKSPWQITADDLMEWMARFEWAPNTRKRAHGSLRAFYNWANESGRTTESPTGILKTIKVHDGVPRPCPDDVLEGGKAIAKNAEHLMELHLAAGTGLRRAELAAVAAKHVEIHSGDTWIRVNGKGSKERVIPLPQDVADWLRGRVWAFPSKYGGHMQPCSVGKRISRMLRGGWSTHTLRHRYATIAYQRTGDIRAVQKLLGHESIRTTQIYVDVAPDALMRAAAEVWAA